MDTSRLRRTEEHLQRGRRQWLLRRTLAPAPAVTASGAERQHPERLVLLVHGLHEHSGRYQHVAEWLASRGCVVHSYDQRGHGHSTGTRGHVARFAELHDDLEAMLAISRRDCPGLPTFLLGHSLGGLVVTSFLRERSGADVIGAVVTNPALSVSEDVAAARIWAARILRFFLPRLAFGSGIEPEALSRDPEVVRAYREDPLVITRLTVAMAAEMFAAARRTRAGGAEIETPMLVLHGEEDPIVPSSGSRDFHQTLASPASRMIPYPRLRHEILNEPERETVLQDALDWMRKLPTGGT